MHLDLNTMRFAEIAHNAHRPAVVGSDRSLTWAGLQAEVSQWIEQAQLSGLQKDTPIVIVGHKEAAFFVAMTASLVLGAPFVPVDTIYPSERRNKIINSVGAALIYDVATQVFVATGHPSSAMAEKNLAYVLFTSGSTGEPKGVQIGRESVRLLGDWMQSCFGLQPSPVFMNQAPFSFDLSMFEFFATLAMGGTCVLNSRLQIQNAEGFIERLAHNKITAWVSTPSFAHQQLLNKRFSAESLPVLSTFLFCGEPLPHALCRRLKQRFPAAQILNTYGPTEATVATTYITIEPDHFAANSVLPIGYAKPDSQVIIKDGEICIIGDHVMRGYLNRPDLNQEKVFMHENGQRGFRTGDLGHRDNSGLLWCDGRRDDQIKLNGYRIELSEISVALHALPNVGSAICLALKRPDNSVARLLGFVQLPASPLMMKTPGWTIVPIEDWKTRLEQRLPHYMLPSEVVAVPAFPMSVNQKINGAALISGYLSMNKHSPQ